MAITPQQTNDFINEVEHSSDVKSLWDAIVGNKTALEGVLFHALDHLFTSIDNFSELHKLTEVARKYGFRFNPYDTHETKLNSIWNNANVYGLTISGDAQKNKLWQISQGSYSKFKKYSENWFLLNGTKEHVILQLLLKLLDVNTTSKIDNLHLRGFNVIERPNERQTETIYIDISKDVKLRGVKNSYEIDRLCELIGVDKLDIPLYFDWNTRNVNPIERYKIQMNGVVVITCPKFKEAIKPHIIRLWHNNTLESERVWRSTAIKF